MSPAKNKKVIKMKKRSFGAFGFFLIFLAVLIILLFIQSFTRSCHSDNVNLLERIISDKA